MLLSVILGSWGSRISAAAYRKCISSYALPKPRQGTQRIKQPCNKSFLIRFDRALWLEALDWNFGKCPYKLKSGALFACLPGGRATSQEQSVACSPTCLSLGKLQCPQFRKELAGDLMCQYCCTPLHNIGSLSLGGVATVFSAHKLLGSPPRSSDFETLYSCCNSTNPTKRQHGERKDLRDSH